ncbi:MAG: hypothetical protein OXK81_06350, partial [Chloroflexota bacterium]|nr:hypothetical protein [Chloroflexota bacterium]
MAEIFLLSLRQLLGRWRLIVILLLAALPSLLVLLIRAIGEGEMAFHGEFVGVVIDAMNTGGIM